MNNELITGHSGLVKKFGCKVFWVFFLEFHFLSHLCQLWLLRDKPVVSSGGNQSTRRKPPPNPKSLATFSHAQAGVF